MQEQSSPGDTETSSVIARAAQMMTSLANAAPLYRPSRFWETLGQQNTKMLGATGITHFKRSLSQNYFNWPVKAPADPQMRVLLEAWARDPSLLPLSAEIRGPGRLESVNDTTFNTNPTETRVYTLFVGLLWWYASRHDPDGVAARLEEPASGDPVPIFQDNRPISQDLANSLRELRRFQHQLTSDPAGTTFAEIGAGYGRLSAVARAATGCRLWIVDIPPALAVAEWYLPTIFPEARVFRWRPFGTWEEIQDEVEGCQLAFFTVDQLPKLPSKSVSVFATVSALHEMTPEQIGGFLMEQARIARAGIYTKNWTDWLNEPDGFRFQSATLKPPDGWQTVFDRPDDIHASFTEKLFVPNGSPQAKANTTPDSALIGYGFSDDRTSTELIENQIKQLEFQRDSIAQELSLIKNSRCWRFTAPLRKLRSTFGFDR